MEEQILISDQEQSCQYMFVKLQNSNWQTP